MLEIMPSLLASSNGQLLKAKEQINNVKGHPGDGITTSQKPKLFRLAQRNEIQSRLASIH